MKYPFKTQIFCIAFLCTGLVSFAQGGTNRLEEFSRRFAEHQEKAPAEELFIHTDRQMYIAGEECLLSLYLRDASNGKPGTLSTAVYVELLGRDQRTIARKRFALENGLGSGAFTIPRNTITDTYILRVYTHWMQNLPASAYYSQPLVVFNTRNNKNAVPQPATGNSPVVDFYPEGKRMVQKLPAHLVFRITDSAGFPLNARARLLDASYAPLEGTDVSTKEGLGVFSFTPGGSQYYMAVQQGKQYDTITLPRIHERGIVLHAHNTPGGNLDIKVQAEESYSYQNNRASYLLVHSQSSLEYRKKLFLNGNRDQVTIPHKDLRPGIKRVLLLNSLGQPEAERLVYIPSTREVITVTAREQYAPREKVHLDIQLDTTLFRNHKLSGLSISVAAAAPGIQNLRYGYSMAELCERHYEQEPEWVDLLLQTREGYFPPFSEYLQATATMEYLPEKQGILLKGNVRNTKPGEEKHRLYLSIPGKTARFQYADIHDDGSFSFLLRNNLSETDLIIRPSDGSIRRSNISIDESFSEAPFTGFLPPFSPSEELREKAGEWAVNYQLREIYRERSQADKTTGEDQQNSFPDETPSFYGQPDQVIDMDDYIQLPVMEEVFYELIPGVRLRQTGNEYRFFVDDRESYRRMDHPPVLFLDGVYLENPTPIGSMNPENLKKIDVIREKYSVGDVVFHGIISLFTRSGELPENALPANALKSRFTFYDHVPEFTKPHYGQGGQQKERIPEMRNTLYWEPRLQTGEDGKAVATFYCSDYQSEYEVILQGLTDTGERVYYRTRIRITP